MLDLKVVNGTLVIPGSGLVKAGVGIKDGKIAMIGSPGSMPEAKNTVDVNGKYVFPGFIDPHIHLGIFTPFEQECVTETQAALVGGVTTVGLFFGGGDSYLGSLDGVIKTAEKNISTDLMIHLSMFTPQQMEEIPQYIENYGVTSFKFYMAGVKGVFPNVQDAYILQGLRKLAEYGDKTIACAHCEDQSMVDYGYEQVEKVTESSLAAWADAHPLEAEVEAVIRFAYLAKLAQAKAYIVHMSTGNAAKELPKIKEGYDKIFVETTSPYLSVNKNDPIGLLAKMLPPLRDQEDIEELWQAVKSDLIDTFGTDNVSLNKAVKQAENGMMGAMPGYPVLATHVPVLFHEGYHKRGVSLEQIAEKGSRKPAQLFGIYPQKGTIAVGTDGDLTVVDLDKEVVVDHKNFPSLGDFSLYDGKTMKGWPVMTIKGGVVAAKDGEVLTKPGSGKYLRRSV
ncbi:MAG: amidohydrolase family protein [Clostridia bacterium]|jgi:dihydropyrimidinase|nr:amidohydrolase family protein [Clostridia bacterium]